MVFIYYYYYYGGNLIIIIIKNLNTTTHKPNIVYDPTLTAYIGEKWIQEEERYFNYF